MAEIKFGCQRRCRFDMDTEQKSQSSTPACRPVRYCGFLHASALHALTPFGLNNLTLS